MKRIGLLGGTFNPIHNGHLQLANLAYSQCHLDSILFIPAAVPPHKDSAEIVDFSHRVAMIEHACAHDPHFHCCSVEAELTPPTYTIDMLRALRKNPSFSKAHFFFIIGVDAFIELKTWKEYRTVLKEINFILSPRKTVLGCHETILRELGFYKTIFGWQHGEYQTLYELDQAPDDVSSTLIRRGVFSCQNDGAVVPVVVAEYIEKNNLYP